jgi:transcription initiation factor TFIIIB Brf1 subunit/transcription initiation factor TFIIB
MPSHCPDCGSEEIITDYAAGDVICHDCGLVLEGNCIDDGPEWRVFQNDGGGGNQTNPRAEKMSATGGQITTFLGGTLAMYRAHRQVSDIDKNETLAKAFNMIGPMVKDLNLPESVLEKSKEILMYLSNETVPDKIMSADGKRTLWDKSGRHPGALIKVPWGNELFAQSALKSLSRLSLCYLSEDAAKRAKLALCERRDLPGVVGDQDATTPEIVEHVEGEEAPWRVALTLENAVGPHAGTLTWAFVFKVLSRKWENGEAQLCAVINLAYREEADSSAGLEFRKFEAVFPSVTDKEVSRHFVKFKRQRAIVASTRGLDPQDLLPRMCQKLQVTMDCERKALEVLDIMTESADFQGRKQATQTAAAILFAARHLTTGPVPNPRDLGKQAGVQEKTVKDMYEKLKSGRSGFRLNHKFGDEIARLEEQRIAARRERLS